MAKIDIFDALKNQDMVQGLAGQKIYLYSGNNVGKTFQATRFPKPLLLMAESGGNARNVPKIPIDTWNDFLQVVKQLIDGYDKAHEQFETIIIDTAEMLVAISEMAVAKMYGVPDVSMVQDAQKGNPNGFSLARGNFRNQINLLTKHGYTVIFISHETIDEDENSPTFGKLIPYNSNKFKGSTRFLRDLCDFVFYIQDNGIDEESGDVIYSSAICKGTNKVFARSRYPRIVPVIKEFTAENTIAAIEDAIAKTAEDEGAGLVSFTPKKTEDTKEDYFAMLQPYVQKLFKVEPEYIAEQVEIALGAGRKVTDATDDEVSKLATLYMVLVDHCNQMNISV